MKRLLPITLIIGAFVFASTMWANSDRTEDHRLRDAQGTLQAIINAPDHGLPGGLLNRARCVIVMPNVVKAAFIVGAEGGHGVMECRTGADFKGPWGPPVMMTLGGGSFGWQAGAQATDFVLLVMSDHGADSLLHDKVTLGADASAAAGPVGRNAAADTDVALQTDILTYSRTKGLFAGVSLSGATLRPNGAENHDLYGREYTPEQIVRGQAHVQPPAAASGLMALLKQQSPQRS